MLESYRILWHLTELENQADLSKLEREQLMRLIKAGGIMADAIQFAKNSEDMKLAAVYLAIRAAKLTAEGNSPVDFRRTIFKLFTVAKHDAEVHRSDSVLAKIFLQKEILEFETIILKKFSEKVADGNDEESEYEHLDTKEDLEEVGDTVSQIFKAQLPDSEKRPPITRYKYHSYFIEYYEYPVTIGEKFGIKMPYKFPQFAVVKKDNFPICFIRVEEGILGTSMIGVLMPNGLHRTYGEFVKSDRKAFLRRVAERLQDLREQ